MPLYMDAHRNLKGATLEDIKKDHLSDLEAQEKHGVNYIKFWFNEKEQTVFCLCTGCLRVSSCHEPLRATEHRRPPPPPE